MEQSRSDCPLEPIRVLIVDDQPTVRSALRYFLLAFDDLELVGEAVSAEDMLEQCAEARPDVVLMDQLLSGTDPARAIRVIRQLCPQTQVVVLTSFDEEQRVMDTLEAGAVDYLLKNVSAGELVVAIRKAFAGRSADTP